MAVEIDAVHAHGHGVDGRLAAVFDDLVQSHVGQGAAGDFRDIEVGIKGG